MNTIKAVMIWSPVGALLWIGFIYLVYDLFSSVI